MNYRLLLGGICIAGTICGTYLAGEKLGQAMARGRNDIYQENNALYKENLELKAKYKVLEQDSFS